MTRPARRFYCSPVGVECRWMEPLYKEHTRPDWVDMTDVTDDELTEFLMANHQREAQADLFGVGA